MLPNPPTTSPTSAGGGKLWYADYESPWSHAKCINDLPFPFGNGGRPTYDSKAVCCAAAYAGQVSIQSESFVPIVIIITFPHVPCHVLSYRSPTRVFVPWASKLLKCALSRRPLLSSLRLICQALIFRYHLVQTLLL